MFPFNITEKLNESQFTHPSLTETRSAPASSLLFFICVFIIASCHRHSLSFFFFIFYPCGITHTHCTVQYFCALLPKCESP